MADGHDAVSVRLSADEALVLFDLLHRWEDDGVGPPADHGEQVALWSLSALLETVLVEPFNAHYRELVSAARQRLAARG